MGMRTLGNFQNKFLINCNNNRILVLFIYKVVLRGDPYK